MVKLLLLLIILILVNAFLAASEVSVVSLNKNRLRELAEDGDRKAQRLLKFAEEPNIFLSTIQVGITLAGFLASAAAADGFAGKLLSYLRSLYYIKSKIKSRKKCTIQKKWYFMQ